MSEDRVAVIMPCYNEEKWIGDAIDSVMNQDYSGEVILFISNDGSKDDSVKVIESKIHEHSSKKNRSIILLNRSENKGIGFTLNELRKEVISYPGINFIRWLSADDKMYKDNISIMMENYNETGSKFIYSDWTMIDENDNIIKQYSLPDYLSHEDFCVVLWQNCCVNGSTMMIHREVFEKIEFDESFRYGEDWLFFLMCARDFEFSHEKTSTVYYRTHSGQTTCQKMSEIPDNDRKVKIKAMEYWNDRKKKDVDIRTVNWIDCIQGGVESFFSDLNNAFDCNSISINNAFSTFGVAFLQNGNYYRHACFDRSYIVSKYLSKHNELFKPDFYIINDDIAAFSQEINNKVIVFQNPYIDISSFNFMNKLTDIYNYIEYHEMYPLLQKLGAKSSKCNIAVSNYMKNVMDRMGIPCNSVIPHGVDVNMFKPVDKLECRRKFGIETDKPVCVISTKFLNFKYQLIPEIIKNNPDVYFMINFASQVEYKPKLDNVKIIQPLSREDMVMFYNCGDFGLFPSSIESFNLSAVECMACDVPIVVTKTGYFWDNDKAIEYSLGNFLDAIKNKKYISDKPREWVIEKELTKERMVSDYKSVLDGFKS